jgi:hypothetical protein
VGRLRIGDWVCGLSAAALLVLLFVYHDGWSSLGWLALALAVLAIVAAFAVVGVGATRQSPSGPMLAIVAATVLGVLAAVGLLVEGYWLGLVAAAGIVAGAIGAMRDERSPGAVDKPVELRPAPPAS